MMRAMFSGVSGVRVHQAKMDNIGNNISNVNTVGYKSSYMSFEEVYSQTVKGAGSPQGGVGGTNPQQLGLGVGVAAIDVDHTRGTPQRTDRPTDLMINGSGFFVVTNDPSYQKKFYTRAGNFTTDRMGYLTMPNGYKVLGQDGKPIRIDKTTTVTGTSTTTVEISGNVNYDDKYDPLNDNVAYSTSMDVYDNLGRVNSITINFGQKLDGSDCSYRAIQFKSPNLVNAETGAPFTDGKLGLLTPVNVATDASTPVGASFDTNVNYAKFDAKGQFLGIYSGLSIDNATGMVSGGTEVLDSTNKLRFAVKRAGTVNAEITLINNAVNPKINAFRMLTHYPQEGNANGKKVDGNGAGTIETFNVSPSGEIVGNFTNGETDILGTILLANFDNNPGLEKVGSNLFLDTVNSGVAKFGIAGTAGLGSLVPGSIEMSNVDLSRQFTEMIITQRGFQANTRVITTSDEILQELVNLKR